MQKFKAIMSGLWQMWVSKPFECFLLLFSRERQKEETSKSVVVSQRGNCGALTVLAV